MLCGAVQRGVARVSSAEMADPRLAQLQNRCLQTFLDNLGRDFRWSTIQTNDDVEARVARSHFFGLSVRKFLDVHLS